MIITETLDQASRELLMPSESDSPFAPFIWAGQASEPLTPERLLHLTEHPSDAPVETTDLDYLFRNVAQPEEWHDAIQQANVAKFRSLMQVLKTNLEDLHVYRIGSVEIAIYIVGKNGSDLAGLTTKVIET